MWLVSARDLQFRARRFVVAVIVVSAVFAVALAMDGMRRSVQEEGPSIVSAFGADVWLVAQGSTGPFTSTRVLDGAVVDDVQGADRADPVVLSRSAIAGDPPRDVNLIGFVPGGLGSPTIREGREPRAPGEAVLSSGTSESVGDRVEIGGRAFRVVGKSAGGRYYFGVPTAFVDLSDAQAIVFKGAPLITAVAVTGDVRAPKGTTAYRDAEVVDDLNRPLEGGYQGIAVTAFLMWLIAAGIIGLIVYLSAIERTRDFAVFKATGAPNRVIVGGLMIQAVLVALVAALIGVPLSRLVAQGMPTQTGLNWAAVTQLVVVAVVVGVLASLVAVRRALTTDPAVAFGGK
jgi:putative ABC transport system permease protein